jgi:hypothetical protein
MPGAFFFKCLYILLSRKANSGTKWKGFRRWRRSCDVVMEICEYFSGVFGGARPQAVHSKSSKEHVICPWRPQNNNNGAYPPP